MLGEGMQEEIAASAITASFIVLPDQYSGSLGSLEAARPSSKVAMRVACIVASAAASLASLLSL
jgi:hypothetical protein